MRRLERGSDISAPPPAISGALGLSFPLPGRRSYLHNHCTFLLPERGFNRKHSGDRNIEHLSKMSPAAVSILGSSGSPRVVLELSGRLSVNTRSICPLEAIKELFTVFDGWFPVVDVAQCPLRSESIRRRWLVIDHLVT